MNFIYVLIIILIALILLYPKMNIGKEDYLKKMATGELKPLDSMSKADFYIPQSTLESVSLSKNMYNNQANANSITLSPIEIEGDTTIVRNDPSMDNSIVQPRIIRKDNMFPNMIGNTEYKLFLDDPSESDKSFEDRNISQLPDFYKSDLDDEITNIGKFFDDTNQYVGSDKLKDTIPSNCYMDDKNEIICVKTKLEELSKTDCQIKQYTSNLLPKNGVGVFDTLTDINQETYVSKGYITDNVSTGSNFFNEVYASDTDFKDKEASFTIDAQTGLCY